MNSQASSTQGLSRPQRRRLLRAGKKGGGQGQESLPPQSQRKLVLSFILILFACVVLALVVGGGLWIGLPLWLKALGWTAAVAAGGAGFVTWARHRKTFRMGAKWSMWLALALLLGAVGGYTYSQMVRELGELLDIRSMNTQYRTLMESTARWHGEAWNEQACNRFHKDNTKLQHEVLASRLPPTESELRLLMATSQVGYQAGCDVDFDQQASALLDKDNTWKKMAPWQYQTLRIWVNEGGWPRNHIGCTWEVTRAQNKKDPDLVNMMENLCEKAQNHKFVPWEGGKTLDLASKMVAEQKSQRAKFERALEERKRQKTD
jgi:hypothetical protein